MSFIERPYQRDGIEASLDYLTDPKMKGRNGLTIAPTGSGKSLLIGAIATRLKAPTLVFQPSKEILEQNAAKLAGYGYKAAIFSASMGRREVGTITLATIGSVVRYPEVFKDVRYILVDEAHAVNAQGGMYDEFLATLDARILGLTATPFRLASNSFGSQLRFLTRTRPRVFRDVVHVTQIQGLVRDGYWTPLRYATDRMVVDRSRLKLNSKGTDYTDESVQGHLLEVGFVGELQAAVEQQLDEGRKNALVFTRFVHESERLAKAVPGTAVVTANTPPRDRARILDDFRRGKIRVVSNVGVVALGFDFPELECVILGRPSISLALYYQQVGRAVRTHPSKSFATIVDMVGLSRLFGKAEDLVLEQVGKGSDQWVMSTTGRHLTNCFFSDRDAMDPKTAAKANARRRFWAKRRTGTF